MSCCSQPSVSDSVINDDYSDFQSLSLPTLLAHRLSPSDEDCSTGTPCDSGVSLHSSGAHFETSDDDDDEPPPVLDLYGRALPETLQSIEDEAPSTPEDSSDVPPLKPAMYKQNCVDTFPSTSPMPTIEKAFDMISGKVRRSARQARQRKEKKCTPDPEEAERSEDCRAEIPDWNENISCDSTDNDACVWANSERLNCDELEEFFSICRNQLDMTEEEVLEALYKNNYDFLATLEHIEEFIGPRNEPFSKSDVRAFFQGMKACNNNDFLFIKTNYLPKRKVTELVDFYYKTKKTRCFGQPNDRCCPLMMKLYTDDPPLNSRSECANCCGIIQNKNFEKDMPTLCAICDLYFRKTQRLRPLFLASTSEASNVAASNTVNAKEEPTECSSISTSSPTNASTEHSCSFFMSKLKKLRTARWTPYEKEQAVIAFYKFGKDFAAVAKELGTKTAADLKRFYVNYSSDYRLDFLVNHSNCGQKVEKEEMDEKSANIATVEQRSLRRQAKKRRT